MDFFPMFRIQRSTKTYKERKATLQKDYRSLYRFDEANVEWIANHFLGESHETRGGALSNKQRMQIFLRYISDPGFQKGIGEEIGVDQSTVCKVVTQVRKAILDKADLWIKFPSNAAEILQAKQEWTNKFSIPCVIGVIDCTHVQIPKPGQSGDEYINRKRQATINVQGTCDSSEKFTSVVAEWPGSVHDSRIFKTSEIYQFLKQKTENTALLGDSGYGIAPWVLTPYKNPRDATELHYNFIYAKERVIIERCFGQVKRRFPILAYKVRVSLEKVSGMIICCFLLHNVAKYLNDANDFPDVPTDDDDDDETHSNESDTTIRARGQAFRQRIANNLYLNR